MDIRTKLYQMFILGTEGGGYNDALKNGLGGMIFFTRDIQSLKQFRELINDIKSASITAPFLSIDRKAEGLNAPKIYITVKNIYLQNLLMKRAMHFLEHRHKKSQKNSKALVSI